MQNTRKLDTIENVNRTLSPKDVIRLNLVSYISWVNVNWFSVPERITNTYLDSVTGNDDEYLDYLILKLTFANILWANALKPYISLIIWRNDELRVGSSRNQLKLVCIYFEANVLILHLLIYKSNESFQNSIL